MSNIETIIVTRHSAFVAYLAEIGIVGTVIAHATPEDVRGKRVVGILPLPLAALAERVGVVDLSLTPDQRGKELTLEEVRAAASPLSWYCAILL